MVDEESYDIVARFYDLEFSERPEESRFCIGYAKKLGPPVLELGCGTGKVLIPIAKSGVEVWGLDVSEGTLNVARKKIELLNKEVASRVTLRKGDMRNFSLPKEFNLIIIPFASFHNLTTAKDQKKALRCIYNHLTRRGLLIIDLISPQLLGRAKRPIKEINDGRGGKIKITQYGENDFSRKPPVTHTYRTYEETLDDGSIQTTSWRETSCHITREKMEYLLSSQGFTVLNVYRNFSKDPYDAEIPSNMYFIAKLTP